MKRHILPIIILFLLLVALVALFFAYLEGGRGESIVGNDPFIKVKGSEVRIPNKIEDMFVPLTEGTGHFIIPETSEIGHVMIGDAYATWEENDRQDFLAVLNVNRGVSKTSTYLVLIDMKDETFAQKSGVLLGDRIEVESVEVLDGDDATDIDYEIIVHVLVRREGASFSERPSVSVERLFSVSNQTIKEFIEIE